MVAGVLSMFKLGGSAKPEVVGVGQMVEEINAGAVKKITVEGDLLKVELNDPKALPQEVKKNPPNLLAIS